MRTSPARETRDRPNINCDSLDLSWNYASESQAYDRVHRLGQEKEVFVKRLVVNDTLEERYVRFICRHRLG